MSVLGYKGLNHPQQVAARGPIEEVDDRGTDPAFVADLAARVGGDRAGSPLRIEFLPGRLRFVKPGQAHIGPNERPPFGCCLAIWERTGPPPAWDEALNLGELK